MHLDHSLGSITTKGCKAMWQGMKAVGRFPQLVMVLCLAGLVVGIAYVWISVRAEDGGAGPGTGAIGQVGQTSEDASPSLDSSDETDQSDQLDEELKAQLLADTEPSLCGGLSRIAGNGMGSLLRERGLADRLPADVAGEVGTIRGHYCATDVLADKVAIIFISEDGESGFALSNDSDYLRDTISSHREWADIPSDDRLTSIIGRADDLDASQSASVDIESLLQKADSK